MNFTDPNFSSWSLVVIYPHNDVIGKFQKASIQSLYISLFIFFVSTLFMYILSVRFSKPIMKLAREAEQIRELQLKGNVEVHSNLKEIAILATSMDSMKASLRSFALYMPRDLVRYLLKENKEITIGGEEKEITIFFSDIEGFTSISENIKPEEIANRLSGYFSLMGDSISQYNGTIDKFIGDAVMAFWGAPHDDDMHIEHACRAALMAQSLLEVFNADLVKQGFSPFRTRIGIHTGLSVVGNIGSNDRMNYTVLGDNVNLASRLEALNKHYGSLILISQAVKDKLPSSFITRPLDKVAVKGKEHGTVILELMGCSDIKTVHSYEKMKEMAELFQNAFELYLDRSWNDAIEAFEKIQLLYPDDMPTKILLKRCNDFSETPPDENWNGAFHMKEK